MERHILQLYPPLPENPGSILYFWHQLAWAVPGFLTFAVGLFLFCAGLYAIYTKEKKRYFFAFAITTLGFGFLGLILALRAVILEREILLYANNYLYWFVLPLSPGCYFLIYYITDKKYRIVFWSGVISLLTVLFGFIGIVQNAAFTGQWLEYTFGHYPVSAIYLKPWGIVSAISYFLIAIPAFFFYYRNQKEKLKDDWPLILSLNLLIILTISNLPSFLGYPIFPGANFSFIPMLLLAYGVFRSDFLNLNDLLFKRNGLFYITNALLTLTFTAIAALVAWGLSPSSYTELNWFPWVLLPLISAMAVFGFGIVIGGSNPGEKINQMGAFSLYTYGFLMIAIIAHSLTIEPIIVKRIEQLCYMVFGLAISVQLRFAFLAMNEPLPKYTFLFDISAVIISAMAISPFLFKGYYSYSFGNIGAGSYVISFMGIVGTLLIVIIIRTWWKARKKRKNPLGDWMALYIIITAILTILNLPSTMGYPFYPFSNLIFIPTCIVAYALLKYGGSAIHSHAFKINQKFSMILLILIPVFLGLYYPEVSRTAPLPDVLLHLALIGIPVILLSYQSTFLLTRPISLQLDEIYTNLTNAKQNAEESRVTAESALVQAEKLHIEMEKSNEFSKLINDTMDEKEILNYMFQYMKEYFNIEAAFISLVDTEKNVITTHESMIPEIFTQQQSDFLKNNHVPLSEDGGFLYKVFKRKQPLYLKRTDIHIGNESDRMIIKNLAIKSFLIVPLIIQDQVTGLVFFTCYKQQLKLTRKDIKSISRFCEQIAGAIYSSTLLRETDNVHRIAEKEREKNEDARAEIEKLNEFSKKINATTNLDEVLDQVFEYFDNSFDIESVIVQLVDKEKNELYTYKTTAPDNATPEQIDFSRKMILPMDESSGPIYSTYKRKKPFYNAKVDNRTLMVSHENIKKVISTLELKSFLLMPLVIQNDTIAILLFTSYKKKFHLNKTEIKSISRFCEQIAGAIYSTSLLKQVQEERARAESARIEAEIAREAAIIEQNKSDQLLLNILPAKVAEELKMKGEVEPLFFDSATVLFTDFIGFTKVSETMSPDELIQELDGCFTQFDEIVKRNKLEKLKTIGDSYMCAGGLPDINTTHPVDMCMAALELQAFMNQMGQIKHEMGFPFWELRLGINTGYVIAGVVGKNKFAYDIWGDTVNTASRMESSGVAGKINISGETFNSVKDFFDCEYRGEISAKSKGEVDMYFLNSIKSDLTIDNKGMIPNDKFHSMYRELNDRKAV